MELKVLKKIKKVISRNLLHFTEHLTRQTVYFKQVFIRFVQRLLLHRGC